MNKLSLFIILAEYTARSILIFMKELKYIWTAVEYFNVSKLIQFSARHRHTQNCWLFTVVHILPCFRRWQYFISYFAIFSSAVINHFCEV